MNIGGARKVNSRGPKQLSKSTYSSEDQLVVKALLVAYKTSCTLTISTNISKCLFLVKKNWEQVGFKCWSASWLARTTLDLVSLKCPPDGLVD